MTDYIKREDAIEILKGWKISGEMILAPIPSADVVEVDKAIKAALWFIHNFMDDYGIDDEKDGDVIRKKMKGEKIEGIYC